jgi:putative Ca2+/H+ antiporter (TMEM165/GDT1 family)
LAEFAGVFGLIFVLELPDKTMIATVVMSARSRPLMVVFGASSAFVIHMALAAVAGGLLAELPHTPKNIVVAILFLAGAGYLLFVPEKKEEERANSETASQHRATAWREALTAFTVIFVSEFGDLSQIQAANLVARTHQALLVFFAASSALICVTTLGAFAGQTLVRYVPLAKVRLAGGLIFAGLGVYTVVSLFTS